MADQLDLVPIGRIVGVHGLKGFLKVDPLTDFESRFAKGARVFLNDEELRIADCMWHKNRPLLKLPGCNSIEQAECLRGKTLYADRSEMPELDEDEFFTEDLIGLKVVTTAGESLGKVDDVWDTPAHDTLVVGEILIPVVKQFVKSIDIDEQLIVVELIPGMRPGEE